MIKEALTKLSYAVFPRRCELCGEVVALDEALCEECAALSRIEGELCNKCGEPKESCQCTRKTKTPEYKAVIAPYYYEKSVSAAANRFKDFGFTELAPRMGSEMSEHISCYYKDIEFDYITYVPITEKKQQKRGYNQSELLANEVSEHLGVPVEKLVDKIKTTPQQKKSSASKRKLNLRGSFEINPNADVRNKTVLLIDDIKTTGSTLNECAYVLNAYGAKAVYAAAFCLTKSKKSKRAKEKQNEQE